MTIHSEGIPCLILFLIPHDPILTNLNSNIIKQQAEPY